MSNLGFVLRENLMNATSYMTDSQFRQIITGLFEYAVEGRIPKYDEPLLNSVFEMEKAAIDGIRKKREEDSPKVKTQARRGNYVGRIEDIIK